MLGSVKHDLTIIFTLCPATVEDPYDDRPILAIVFFVVIGLS